MPRVCANIVSQADKIIIRDHYIDNYIYSFTSIVHKNFDNSHKVLMYRTRGKCSFSSMISPREEKTLVLVNRFCDLNPKK